MASHRFQFKNSEPVDGNNDDDRYFCICLGGIFGIVFLPVSVINVRAAVVTLQDHKHSSHVTSCREDKRLSHDLTRLVNTAGCTGHPAGFDFSESLITHLRKKEGENEYL